MASSNCPLCGTEYIFFDTCYSEECNTTKPYIAPVRLHNLVGRKIRLLRHSTFTEHGDDNWSSEMDSYIGRIATITKVVFLEEEGYSPDGDFTTVEVDVDGGDYHWRLEEMEMIDE